MQDLDKFYRDIKQYETNVITSFKTLKKNLYEMMSLFDMGKILPQIKSVEKLVDLLLLSLRGHLKMNAAAVVLKDIHSPDQYKVISQKGYKHNIDKLIFKKSKSKLMPFLLKQGKTVTIKQVLKNTNKNELYNLEMMKTAYITPLIIGEDLRGFFVMGDKPKDAKVTESELSFVEFLANTSVLSIEYLHTLQILKEKYWNLICILANAIESRHDCLHGHSRDVTEVALKIGRKMDFSPEDIEILSFASILHDIGTIAIDKDLLDKPSKLTDDEFDIVKKHPKLGETILIPIPFFDTIREVIRQHHERWDGTGYPDGLKGNKISIHARIIGVADSFSAMNSDRPYRKALSLNDIVKEFKKQKGKQYDPKVVDILLNLIKKGEIKSSLKK